MMNISKKLQNNETIFAMATHQGIAAIGVIRISGNKAFTTLNKIFNPTNKSIRLDVIKKAQLIHGLIKDNDTIIDEVIVSTFPSPKSYTGEDVVEISCHGSRFILEKIMKMLVDKGLRPANAGEFTLRAFVNCKMDLTQAEAVADLIASNSENAHNLAIKQMRGNFSNQIKHLRTQLINFSSLLELELDFSEEQVEFANRDTLLTLLNAIKIEVKKLLNSFALGNVMKNGIPVAIIGKPNVGKSTLLNILLNEDRALVSEIPGTTRDAIEDIISLNGYSFRFIDTAGLRESDDTIENMGIEKTYEKIEQAAIILYIFDASKYTVEEVQEEIKELRAKIKDQSKKIIIIGNKIDQMMEFPKGFKDLFELETIFISAKRKENIELIEETLIKSVTTEHSIDDHAIISNIRHYDALDKSLKSIIAIEEGLQNELSNDLLTIDVRSVLHYLGEITGEISTDEILENVFNQFCIGK